MKQTVQATDPLRVRRRRAIARAIRVLRHLRRIGVAAAVAGSLAEGRFGLRSDVDFLILACPRHLKYRIEAAMEDIMLDIPFDAVYCDEARARVLQRMKA